MVKVAYEEQKTYWESHKKRRSPGHPAVVAFARPKLSFVANALAAPADRSMTMLEVGAGNGYFSVAFDEVFDLTALDFSANMLEMNPLPTERKVQGDAEHLPFSDDAFDVVLCGNLLHHLADPVVAVREMRRVARRHVVLIEPNIVNPLMLAFGLVKKAERGSLKFTPGYVKRLGREAGLVLRRFASQGAIVPNKTPHRLVPLLRVVDRPSPLGFYHVAVFDVR